MGVRPNMKNAAEYLKENVVKRLTGKMRADQIVALSQAQLSSRSSFVPGQSNHTTTSTFFGDGKGGKEGGENGGGEGKVTSNSKSFHDFLARQNELNIRKR